MTWTLNASGHTPASEGESTWEHVERELLDELHKVLSNPRYGVAHSNFAGNHIVSDTVHVAEVPQAAAEAPVAAEGAPEPDGEALAEPEPVVKPAAKAKA